MKHLYSCHGWGRGHGLGYWLGGPTDAARVILVDGALAEQEGDGRHPAAC